MTSNTWMSNYRMAAYCLGSGVGGIDRIENRTGMVRELTHFIGGQQVPGTSGNFGDVYDPSTGQVQARVPLASVSEVEAAIANAAEAQRAWAAFNPQKR